MAFVIIPIMVARAGAGETRIRELIKTILTNSFVIAVILGLGLNLLGTYNFLSNSSYLGIYSNTTHPSNSTDCRRNFIYHWV